MGLMAERRNGRAWVGFMGFSMSVRCELWSWPGGPLKGNRRRSLTRLASAAILGLPIISGAQAEQTLPLVAPFKPELRENADDALCRPFAAAWTKVFQGEKDLQADWIDLEEAFPEAEVFSFPPEGDPRVGGRYRGLYDRSFHRALDFDGDGENEVLHIEGYQIGWRYLGAKLYLFESEADLQAAKLLSENSDPGPALFVRPIIDVLDPAPRHLLDYWPASVYFFLVLNGDVYTTASPRTQIGPDGSRVGLIRLNGGQGPQQVCTLELLPRYENVQAFEEESTLFQSLKAMYGGPMAACMGTMGWTAPPAQMHLLKMFHRPQVMRYLYDQTTPDSDSEDAARELRLLSWGVDDPISWSVYTQLKGDQAAFVQQMTRYYRRHFVTDDEEAQALAELAYRFLIDQIIYARNPDGRQLTRVAWHSREELNIRPESPPSAVAAAAIDRWLQMNNGRKSWPLHAEDRLWREAILAALYTRQDLARLGAFWERLEAVLAAQVAKADMTQEKARIRSKRNAYLNQMLLAAMGDRTLTELVIELGGSIDAPTNWFRKTPLMYAAQSNDLAAVQFLLAKGANPSSQPSGADDRCRRLERDGRTPLMYAAENASRELIETLLEAGADVSATDTQGNAAAWYMQRNQKLGDSEKASLLRQLQ